LRQGDGTDPLLFNVVLETAIRRFAVQIQRTIAYKYSQVMAYADGVVIMGRRLQDIKEVCVLIITGNTNK
jgi:hypothetical protein